MARDPVRAGRGEASAPRARGFRGRDRRNPNARATAAGRRNPHPVVAGCDRRRACGRGRRPSGRGRVARHDRGFTAVPRSSRQDARCASADALRRSAGRFCGPRERARSGVRRSDPACGDRPRHGRRSDRPAPPPTPASRSASRQCCATSAKASARPCCRQSCCSGMGRDRPRSMPGARRPGSARRSPRYGRSRGGGWRICAEGERASARLDRRF